MADAENKVFELKVGIFIAVGILLFFIMVFSIGDVYLIKKGYTVDIIFNFVNGIGENAPVRLAGVNVGQVEKIKIFFDEKETKTKVKVSIWIQDEKIRIERDSSAVINTLGLLGEKYLEIFPGTQRDYLKAGDVITGRDPVSTERIAEKINDLTDSVTTVMMRLKEGEGTAGKLLVEDGLYYDLEAFAADIRKHPWKLLHKPREMKKK